jgi:hypothetical protein
MTREKLIAVIKVGIKRGGTPENIADAIELALEMEDPAAHDPAPESDPDPAEIGIPVSSESVVSAPASIVPGMVDAETARQVVEDVKDSTPRITLASESDLKRITEKKPFGPVRIRSLSPMSPSATRMKLEDAVQFWVDKAPETISIIPEGRKEPIVLERSVMALPGFKDPRSRSKTDDFVKLAYKHPMVEAGFEVQYPVNVSDMERGIDVESILDDLKAKARIMYKPRPRTIEPRRPTPEALRLETAIGTTEGTPEDQDRMAAAARSGKGAVASMSDQIRKG